jgi:hypothetical protein
MTGPLATTASNEEVLFQGHPAVLPGMGALLLSKRLEQVDTYRIKDYVVERPLGQRLLGTGNIQLLTVDTTTPLVELRGLPTDVMALYERLRVAAEAERSARAVRVVEEQ